MTSQVRATYLKRCFQVQFSKLYYRTALLQKMHIYKKLNIADLQSVAYAENFHWGGFIQWHMVVIYIWCALFVTSQFEVIFMFPNQRFGKVC